MASEFSPDGKYFAELSVDGVLNVWETSNSSLKQQFTPNLHLTSPCTCLHWISASRSQSQWKKRKRRNSGESSTDIPGSNDAWKNICMGAVSGNVFVYSMATGQIEATLCNDDNQPISCLSFDDTLGLFSAAANRVLEWNFKSKCLKSKWNAGKNTITSILLVPAKKQLIVAAKSICLWCLETREVLQRFIGHSSNVSQLSLVHQPSSADFYFISGTKMDRTLNCWSLGGKTAEEDGSIVGLLMEDCPVAVCTHVDENNATTIAAVARSGVMHVFQHTLNGKCSKPLKPKCTLRIACETGESVAPISIRSAKFDTDGCILISYGSMVAQTFESVPVDFYKKSQCLIRSDPARIKETKSNQLKKKLSTVNNDAHYVIPHNIHQSAAGKRLLNSSSGSTGGAGAGAGAGTGLKAEIPMEKRLENLSLNTLDIGNGPAGVRVDNVAQLLVQGLRSKDRTILESALQKNDPSTVRNTVKRLPMQFVVLLIRELSTLVQGKSAASRTGAIWMKHVLQVHASQLLANPNLEDMLKPLQTIIENRLVLLTPLCRLRGRLDHVVAQIIDSEKTDNVEIDEALLVYKDQVSSDSSSIVEFNALSESDNEWVEEDSAEEDVGKDAEEEDDGSDAMSM